MMNAEAYVEEVGEEFSYFQSSLKLIVYGYLRLKKSEQKYSRPSILAKAEFQSKNPGTQTKNPIEDYLRNDLVCKFIAPNRNLFQLDSFIFQSGVEEFKDNIKVGILDIKVISPFLTEDNIYYVFECKRLNKYAKMQDEYIKNGIIRFTSRQYYPETDINIAGMIGFVEVDLEKSKRGLESIDNIVIGLKQKIEKKYTATTYHNLEFYRLSDERFEEIADFEHSYRSEHFRDDNTQILIHHLLLDYYDILTSC